MRSRTIQYVIRNYIVELFCNLNQEAQFQLYQIRYFQICFERVKLLVFIYLSKY